MNTRKRTVSFKCYKNENVNRDIVLWDGRPSPFTIGTTPIILEEYPNLQKQRLDTDYFPEFNIPKPREITPKEWFELVKKNESGFFKKKKLKKKSPPQSKSL